MRFLSVADRELRAAARQVGTWRVRWVTALGFLGLLVWMLWMCSGMSSQRVGRTILEGLSTVTFFYCLLVGTARTADCLSSERREGTLGLLFLTNLNSAEIVAGKLCSSALAGMYGLFAVFPMLGMTLLLGGVTFGEFGRVVLALVNTVFFSVAAGFLASVFCRRQFQAIAVALALALGLGAGLLGVAEVLRSTPWAGPGYEVIAAFCPLTSLIASDPTARVVGANPYWVSLGAVAALTWMCLGLVVWRLSRIWRDRPESKRRRGWFRLRRRPAPGRPAGSAAFRRRLLEINPYFWLGSRQRIASPVFMGLVVAVVGLTIWVSVPYCQRLLGRSTTTLEAYAFAWMWTGMLLHALVTYYAAWVASQRLAEDKQAGALELVLSTPTTERSIGRGLWLAYGRRMAFPVLVAALAHLYFIYTGATMIALLESGQLPPGRSVGELLWSALWDLPLGGHRLSWEFGFILRIMLWILALLAAVWLALGWVARWLGLRMKHPGFAPITSLGLVLVPPVILFSSACFLADRLGLYRLPERQFLPLMMWIGVGLQLGHCALLSAWAARRLRRDFRTTVTQRFQPPPLRARWRPSWRGTIRWATRLAAACLVLALAVWGFYIYQEWRGQRAWAAFERGLKQRGESLELAGLLPPPVPDSENFARSPIFAAFKDPVHRQTEGYPVAIYAALQNLEYDYGYGNPNSKTWIQQSRMSFDVDLARLRRGSAGGGTTNRPLAASQVLGLLEPFATALHQVEAASHLPFFRGTTNRTALAVHREDRVAVGHLQRLHYLFQLRATARLAAGRIGEAADDVGTSLRLVGLARQSPDLRAPGRVVSMTVRSLQPLWEGLEGHHWNEQQLATLQTQLAAFDLLADYTNALNRVVRANIELWRERAASDPGWRRRALLGTRDLGLAGEALQPRIWWLDRCIRFYNLGRAALDTVDVAAGRVVRSLDWSLLNEVPLDGDVQQFFTQQSLWWGLGPGSLAFTQNAVNEAVAACALERYWLARGKYPEDLAELVPQWLAAPPRDVMTGRSLGYERTDDGRFALRSVGVNGVDDRKKKVSDDWLWAYPTPTNAPGPVSKGGRR